MDMGVKPSTPPAPGLPPGEPHQTWGWWGGGLSRQNRPFGQLALIGPFFFWPEGQITSKLVIASWGPPPPRRRRRRRRTITRPKAE